jgi:putative hemolysin
MILALCILLSIVLNALLSMMASVVLHNKEIEDDSYKYLVTIQWLSMVIRVVGIMLALTLFVPMLPCNRILSTILVSVLFIYIYILLSDRLPTKYINKNMNKASEVFMKFVYFIQTICTPFTFFLRFKVDSIQEDYSEEDIREMINSGSVEEPQKEFIENLFEFDDTPVEEICTHRSEVICLYLNESDDEWNQIIHDNRHTFYPVCDKDNDDVIGILDTRDYFRLDDTKQDNVINQAIDQPFFVSQNMKADQLLKEMKIKKVYFAILLDEYGGMTGIVTLHDIIETLLGEIQEEDDIEEPDPIQQIDANQWRIYGQADIEDVEETLQIQLPDEDYDTFGGYVLGCYGKIPDDGSIFTVHLENMDVYVKEMKSHRIGQTIVQMKNIEEGREQ